MYCVVCLKHVSEWDPAYLGEAEMPKYYTETKGPGFIDRQPLCGPYCSLEYHNKQKGQDHAN